jgi:hypothetical protein
MPCSVGADGKSGKLPPPDVSNIPAAVAAAKAADVAVLFLGVCDNTLSPSHHFTTLPLYHFTTLSFVTSSLLTSSLHHFTTLPFVTSSLLT